MKSWIKISYLEMKWSAGRSRCPIEHKSCRLTTWQSDCRRWSGNRRGSQCGRAVRATHAHCPRASWANRSSRCCRGRRTPQTNPTVHTRMSLPLVNHTVLIMIFREKSQVNMEKTYPWWSKRNGVHFISGVRIPHDELAVLRGRDEVARIRAPVHGIDLGQMAAQCAPSSHLYAPNRLERLRRLQQCRIACCFACILCFIPINNS